MKKTFTLAVMMLIALLPITLRAQEVTVNNVTIDVTGASKDNPVDVTGWVISPTFDDAVASENYINGWTGENTSWLTINKTWNVCNEDGNKANPCLDFGPAEEGGRIYQTLTGLPSGTYTVTANVFSNGDGSFFAYNMTEAIEANAQNQPAKTLMAYISGSEMSFGMQFPGTAWAQLDNVVLKYYGPDKIVLDEEVTPPVIMLYDANAQMRQAIIVSGKSSTGNDVVSYFTTDGSNVLTSLEQDAALEYYDGWVIDIEDNPTTVKALSFSVGGVLSEESQQTFRMGSYSKTYDASTSLVVDRTESVWQTAGEGVAELSQTLAGAEQHLGLSGTWVVGEDGILSGTADSHFSILGVKKGDMVIVKAAYSWVFPNMLLQNEGVETMISKDELTAVYTVTGDDVTQIDFRQRKDGRYWQYICINKIIMESDTEFEDVQIDEQITAPAINLAEAGALKRTVTITGGKSNTGKTVTTYYTTDGTAPSSASAVYADTLTIAGLTTIKAITINEATGKQSEVAEATFGMGTSSKEYVVAELRVIDRTNSVWVTTESGEVELTQTLTGAESQIALGGQWAINDTTDPETEEVLEAGTILNGTGDSRLSILGVKQGDYVVISTSASWVPDNIVLQTEGITTQATADGMAIVYHVDSEGVSQIDFSQRQANGWWQYICLTGIAIETGGEASGISSVESKDRNVKSVYNLNGQRVAKPSHGLYIIDGKKVIMK